MIAKLENKKNKLYHTNDNTKKLQNGFYSQTHSLSCTGTSAPMPFQPVTSHSYSIVSSLVLGSSAPLNFIPSGHVYTTLDVCSKTWEVGSNVEVSVVGVATRKQNKII